MSYDTFMYLASIGLVIIGVAGLASTLYCFVREGMYRGYVPVARLWIPRESLALCDSAFRTLRGIHLGGCVHGRPARKFKFGEWDEAAHAHLESGIICIYDYYRGVAGEWLLAHEIAHLEAAAHGETQMHGRTWQAVLSAIGYQEEADCYRGAERSNYPAHDHEFESKDTRHLLVAAMARDIKRCWDAAESTWLLRMDIEGLRRMWSGIPA